MKQGVKLAIVGIAGYFIGYYKFKYKFVKTIANEYIDSQLKNDDTDETEPLLGLERWHLDERTKTLINLSMILLLDTLNVIGVIPAMRIR